MRVEARLERREAVLESLREAATSPYGDIDEYRALIARRDPTPRSARDIEAALSRLRPGDVVMLETGRHVGPAAVLTTAQRKGSGPRVRALTPNRVQVPLSAQDFTTPPHVVAARKATQAQGRLVRYVMTVAGPEPADEVQHALDREHYVAKQVRPVAEPVLATLGLDFEQVIGDRRQLDLLGGL